MSYSDPKIRPGKYLKIEAGEPHDLRLLSAEPAETFEHFSPGGSIECKGDMCAACQDGDEAQQKFSTNVYDHTTQRVYIWKYGAMIAKMLKAIAITLDEENASIMNVDLKVEATGSNKSKKYSVTPRMTAKPIPQGLQLHKLEGDVPF